MNVRRWPKPRYTLVAGLPVLEPRELPRSREAFLAEDGVRVPSYAFRYLAHGTNLLPRRLRRWPDGDHDERMSALNVALLDQLVSELDSAGVDYFFLLFHGWAIFRDNAEHLTVREELVEGELARLGVRWISSRPAFEEHIG